MANATGNNPKSSELSENESRSTFSLLPHVLKLTKGLYNGADSQTIHSTVSN